MLPLVLLLVACGPSREGFADDFATLSCEKVSECYGQTALQLLGYDDLETCKAEAPTAARDEADENSCPEFDREQASLCLEQLAAADCNDIDDVTAACDEVCP